MIFLWLLLLFDLYFDLRVNFLLFGVGMIVFLDSIEM